MTRFTIGEDYVFVHTQIQSLPDRHIPIYMPEVNLLTGIHMVKLRCVKHCKVSNAYASLDGEPTCDGFIFEDAFGARWYNQYPEAHYGQLDRGADRMVSPADETEDTIWKRYNQVNEVLRNLYDVLLPDNDPSRRPHIMVPTAAQRKGLQDYFNSLRFTAEQLLGKRMVIRPLELAHDGKRVATRFMRVTFEGPPVVNVEGHTHVAECSARHCTDPGCPYIHG